MITAFFKPYLTYIVVGIIAVTAGSAIVLGMMLKSAYKDQGALRAQVQAKDAIIASKDATIASNEAEIDRLGERVQAEAEARLAAIRREREINEARRIEAAERREERERLSNEMASLMAADECFHVPYPDGVADRLRGLTDAANESRGSAGGQVSTDPVVAH